jgi:hydrogenase expression/formation protein HypC
MCIGIPLRIDALDGLVAHCSARGVERTVSLLMLQHETINVGDYIIANLGHAVQKVSEADARITWALFDEILARQAE